MLINNDISDKLRDHAFAVQHVNALREQIRDIYARSDKRIADLEASLFALAGDVEAFHVSCTCTPPVTDKKRANLARARELLSEM